MCLNNMAWYEGLICFQVDNFPLKDYDKHKKLEHNIWNYIHFALYLDTIHPNDHNALEKYIFERVCIVLSI